MALFSTLRSKARRKSPSTNQSEKESQPSLKSYWQYDDIMLSLYFKIANTGNVELLAKSGIADHTECLYLWEDIVKKNAEANGSRDYLNHLSDFKTFAKLNNDYYLVKAMLMRLSIQFDKGIQEDLKQKGYNIAEPDTDDFFTSMLVADKQASNIVTKIKMKENELNRVASRSVKKFSSDKALANLSVSLNMVLPQEITLSLFNEYKLIAKERQTSISKGKLNKR